MSEDPRTSAQQSNRNENRFEIPDRPDHVLYRQSCLHVTFPLGWSAAAERRASRTERFERRSLVELDVIRFLLLSLLLFPHGSLNLHLRLHRA